MNSSGSTTIGASTEPEVHLTTAFVVFIDKGGRVGFSGEPDLLADNVVITRPPSTDEVYGALHNVLRDINAQTSAMQTHSFMISQAQAAARAQEDARIAAKVNSSRVN